MSDPVGTGEADGMDRAVTDALRIGLMTAARAGEQLARRHEQQQRGIQRAESRHARDHEARLTASRAAARAQLAPVARPDWWDAARPDMIAQVHQTATAWRGMDPEAAACAERIRTEVRQRYGIDLPDPAQAASEAAERIEDVTAGAVLAGTANAPAAQPAHDSEQRRRSVAQALAGHPDREAVAARLIAEKHQGTPPGAAVGSRLRTVGWARRAPVFGRRRGVGRDETAP